MPLLAVGLRVLFVRVFTLAKYRTETEGRAADCILSKWKAAPVHRRPGRSRAYTSRWFPVFEYSAAGRQMVYKSRRCILSEERPPALTVRLRYDPNAPARCYVPGEFTWVGWVAAVLFLMNGTGFTVLGSLFLAVHFFA